jgi:hypothetical protein
MRSLTFDPTAGERARHIRERPDAVPLILDPVDSRYGELTSTVPPRAGHEARISDPTDPDCGQRTA